MKQEELDYLNFFKKNYNWQTSLVDDQKIIKLDSCLPKQLCELLTLKIQETNNWLSLLDLEKCTNSYLKYLSSDLKNELTKYLTDSYVYIHIHKENQEKKVRLYKAPKKEFLNGFLAEGTHSFFAHSYLVIITEMETNKVCNGLIYLKFKDLKNPTQLIASEVTFITNLFSIPLNEPKVFNITLEDQKELLRVVEENGSNVVSVTTNSFNPSLLKERHYTLVDDPALRCSYYWKNVKDSRSIYDIVEYLKQFKPMG